jgi:ribonuclease BN (tRNA processing enzyme)
VKVQLLPSSVDKNGAASARQHLTCFVIDDCVTIDAGSLAMACSDEQFENIRDIVLTHAHLDHIAGLPLFIDDLFAKLSEPVRVHATREMIEILERDIFNWSVYPRFSELSNANGPVMQYVPYEIGREFTVRNLRIKAVAVNHLVPAAGFIVSNGNSKFAITGDTAAMDDFWEVVNREKDVSALLVECAFPNYLCELADISHHLTPAKLSAELAKFDRRDCPIFVINLKPAYREDVIAEIGKMVNDDLEILNVGKVYEW